MFSFQDGTLLLDGKTPEELGVPQWRTQVTYVPQSRTQQKGTPSELYFQAQVRSQDMHSSFLAAASMLCRRQLTLMEGCLCSTLRHKGAGRVVTCLPLLRRSA